MGALEHLLSGPAGMVMDGTYEYGVARGGGRRWILIPDDVLLDPSLLYVGKSIDPESRRLSHENRAWWSDVVRQEVTCFPSEPDALASEDLAIRNDNPLYNRVTSVKR